MVTMHPTNLRLTDFAHAKCFYRGMSTPREQWEPLKPLLDSVEEWEKCVGALNTADQLAYEHVLAPALNQQQEHAVSVSGRSRVARHYALSRNNQPYSKKQGFVGIFHRAPVRRVHALGGMPFLFICADETVWLNPHSISPSSLLYQAAPSSFEYARDSAGVDDEFLLVFGKITSSKLLPVTRIPAHDHQHKTWQCTVNTAAPLLGLSVPQPPPFKTILHHRNRAYEAAVFASVLGG